MIVLVLFAVAAFALVRLDIAILQDSGVAACLTWTFLLIAAIIAIGALTI